jgi:hypothetical protein
VPIRIREGADPLSDASRQASDDSVLIQAQSEASRLLRQELQRYCRGEINGRSFLIAGHRGAGKTTMVADAVDRVLRLSGTVPLDEQLRPLPVFLHGPSLFDQGTEGSGQALEEQARTALTQIILGLHRAVVREFARAYHWRLRQRHGGPAMPAAMPEYVELSVKPAWGAYAELSAQFELELGGDPSAARLREFWALADALEEGVLAGPADRYRADRGAQELVALSGVCEAYRRISGELSSQAKSRLGQETKDERSTGVTLKGAELVRPVVSVLSGAAVAGGVATAAGVAGALFAGLATALASSLMFTQTRSASESRSDQTDTTFIPDLSLKTLDRVLPTLLQRLRNAGLAPVLIVDELDKVEKLSERIAGMIRFLKKLVAENVFTCFLTDRGYLEQQRLDDRGAYSPSYSYFSHSLLVSFQPADFDAYLDRLLYVDTDAQAAGQPAGAASAPAADGLEGAAPPAVGDGLDKADQLDLEVLKWVLRHRAELHALTLNREIALLRDDSQRLVLGRGMVRTQPGYRIAATFQVVIELQLAQPGVAAWLRLHPERGQTLIDALYYLSRCWVGGESELDWGVGPAVREKLADYLIERMNLEVADADRQRRALPSDDIQLLRGVVDDMVGLLSQTTSAEHLAQRWVDLPADVTASHPRARPTQAVNDALLLGPDSLLLMDTSLQPPRYSWRYRPSGMLRDVQAPVGRMGADFVATSGLQVHEKLAAALAHVDKIQALETLLEALLPQAATGGPAVPVFEFLAEGVRLLPTSPAWQPVRIAMASLQHGRASLAQTAEVQAQIGAVQAFAQMLDQNWSTMARTLYVAAYLCGTAQRPDGGARLVDLRDAVSLLAEGLRFARLSAPEMHDAIESVAERLQWAETNWRLPTEFGETTLQTQVQASFEQGVKRGEAYKREEKAEAAWAAARDYLLRLPAHRDPLAPSRALSVPELIAAMDSLGPVRLLGRDYEAAPIYTWSLVLLMALGRVKNAVSRMHQVPAWLIPTALRRLGAQALLPRQLAQLMSWLLAMPRTTKGSDEELAPWLEVTSLAKESGRFALCLFDPDGSPMRRWFGPPESGMVLLVRHRTAPEALAQPDLTGLGMPVVVAADGSLQGMFTPKPGFSRTAVVPHVWVFGHRVTDMRLLSLVNPAGPDEVLRHAVEPVAAEPLKR